MTEPTTAPTAAEPQPSPRAFTYVVLAHTDPQGVLRLVRRVRELSPEAGILVRYDNPDLFAPGAVEAAGGEPFRSADRASWGDWSMVEMMLQALREASRRLPAARYAVVSGQDYPVRDLAAWEAQVTAEGRDALLSSLPDQPADVAKHWTVLREPGGDQLRQVRRVVRALGSRAGALLGDRAALYPVAREGRTRWWVGRPRRGVAPVRIVKASMWSTLSARAVAEVLRADAQDRAVRAFFRTVRVPDEYYLPSLVTAAGLDVAEQPTTATIFDPGAASPRWIGPAELDILAQTPAPFVRKIAPDVDPQVLARADALTRR